MRRRALLSRATSTALLGLATGLAGCAGLSESTDPPTASQTDATPSDPTETTMPTQTATPATVQTGDLPVAVRDHSLQRSNADTEDELVAVAGTLENTGEPTVTDVQVVAHFRDDSDRLGESAVETGELAPGASWAFEVTFEGSGEAAAAVTDYRLVVQTRE